MRWDSVCKVGSNVQHVAIGATSSSAQKSELYESCQISSVHIVHNVNVEVQDLLTMPFSTL
ncbi:hypothetical protein DPMN_085962 [Dreissena polymorpha]|uniref:Uncharacterized protein n=1 Tax=Dreissena polymorpha TaxID=45954 RepID=A0A9D3YEP5_DREPO|nr:hypothetical protein DPMN_085962 [Dreissena polymorpha]